MVTGYTKFDFHEDSHWDIKKTINAYNNYKKRFKFLSLIKGILNSNIYISYHFLFTFHRLWMEEQIEICKDLLWHSNIWHNHEGQSSKVCGHVVSNWRNHGTPHWVLHHQWSGDSLFYRENNNECFCKNESQCLKLIVNVSERLCLI